MEANLNNNNEKELNIEVVNDEIKIEVVKSEESINGKTIVVKTIKEVNEYNSISSDDLEKAKSERLEAKPVEVSSSKSDQSNRQKVSLSEEMFKLDSTITYDYSKEIGDLDYSKIKGYKVEDGDKTISFLFYENDFYAVNKVNYKDGYMYTKHDHFPVGENLNKMIRKIPNVAKARNILHISNIETRIYDMTDYILLLEREDIRVIKVVNSDKLEEMAYQEYNIDKKRLEFTVQKLAIEEAEKEKEAKSIKNKFKGLKDNFRRCVINPIRTMLVKLGVANNIKLLSDGKHSIFEKDYKN